MAADEPPQSDPRWTAKESHGRCRARTPGFAIDLRLRVRPVRRQRSFAAHFGKYGSRIELPGLRLMHQIGGAEQGIERASVGPPAFQIVKTHGSFGDVGVIDV